MRVLPRGSTLLLKLPPKVPSKAAATTTTTLADTKRASTMSATGDNATTRSPVPKLAIERLPDELITHTLLYICTDLKTLCALAEMSPRLRRVAMDVIRLFFLPNIELMTVIDQEGRRKNTTQYVFDTLDDVTLEVRFKPVTASPQRYRNDNYAAPPTLHRLSMSDGNDYSTMVSPQPSSPSSSPANNSSAIAPKQNANNSRRQPSWHTLDSITSNNSSNNNGNSNRTSITTIETGRRKHLQISKPGSFSACSNISLWQLEYMVSTDHSASMSAESTGHERFVTPLFVKAHLSLFSRRQKRQGGTINSKALIQWFKKKKRPTSLHA